MRVGEHECVLIENQRWSIRHREYRCDALISKVDPPAYCTEAGTPTTKEELDARTDRSLEARARGSAIKACRWKEGSRWRASDWQYAMAFQSTFKVMKDRTAMVRRRMWFRTRVAMSRRFEPDPSAARPGGGGGEANGEPAAGAAESGGAADDRPRAVRFAGGTVFARELDNRRWRASAATRAAPAWTRQFFADCVQCEIDPVYAVAAFLAVGGVSAYERQTQARLVLAGKAEWPPESAVADVRKQPPQPLRAVATELSEQLIRETADLGQAEAIATATEHLVFAAINARARLGDPGATAADSPAHSPNPNPAAAAAAAAELPGDGAPAAGRELSPIPDDKFDGFVQQTLSRLELETLPTEGELGYDTADGWFVLDENLDLAETEAVKRSSRGSLDLAAAADGDGADDDDASGGLDVDETMYHSALELDASTLSISSDDAELASFDPPSVYFDAEDGGAAARDRSAGPGEALAARAPTNAADPERLVPTAARKSPPPSPSAKAQIQAEIRLLEEIMRRNRES